MVFNDGTGSTVVRDILGKFTGNLTVCTTDDPGGGAPCQGEGPLVFHVHSRLILSVVLGVLFGSSCWQNDHLILVYIMQRPNNRLHIGSSRP
jgi:hypothetical protein